MTAVETVLAITFQEESLATALPDLAAHWQAHREEVGPRHPQMVLDVDLSTYETLDRAGQLSIVTMRADGALVGYYISVIHPHLHYKQTLAAYNDVFYLAPAYRHQGYGMQLFQAAESLLKARGAQLLIADDKVWRDAGPTFQRCGWAVTGTIYSKWVGEE